jgi:HEAT repeat protein
MLVSAAAAPLAAEDPPPPAQPTAPSPKALEAIQLLNSQDLYQREYGFLRLEALREPATIEVITRYLDDRDPDTRAYSLRALAAVEGARSIPTLLSRLKADTQPRVRRAALLGLEPFEQLDPAILTAEINALRDHDSTVRITAVDIVSRVDDPRAKEAILLRNRHEHHRDVRRALALAMKRLKSASVR